MAPRKKRTFVLARDHAFAKTIGSVKDDKPDPLSLAVAEANRQIETEYPQAAPETPEPAVAAAMPAVSERTAEAEGETPLAVPVMEAVPSDTPPPPSIKAAGDTPAMKTEMPAGRAEQASEPIGGASPETTPEAPQDQGTPTEIEAQPIAAGAGDAASPVELNISIFVPGDLVERAAKWGAAIHQPLKAVMRHSFTKLKPELLAELKSITARDVHQDRGERIGYRLQSRMRFTPTEIADMEARLDPAGFGNLNSILNYYARNRFTAFLDELMASAGY